MEELKPCSCEEDNDTSEIILQELFIGARHALFIVRCTKCENFEPVKVPRYMRHEKDLTDYLYKAWNQRIKESDDEKV